MLRKRQGWVPGLTFGSFLDRAGNSFRLALREAQKGLEGKPEFGEVTGYTKLPVARRARPETSKELAGEFKKGIGYEGWKRSYYTQVWFDSSPEFRFARIVDDAPGVRFWVRLLREDIPILWTSQGNRYNPDFLVVMEDGAHILVEVKDEESLGAVAVQAKKQAAERWIRRVAAATGKGWKYWLVSDRVIKESKGSFTSVRSAAEE